MAEKYQTCAKKSTKKFEVVGRKELALSVRLRLVEVWEKLQPEVEQLTGLAGLQMDRRRSNAAGRSAVPACGRRRLPPLGPAARLCGFWWTESARGTTAGTNP